MTRICVISQPWSLVDPAAPLGSVPIVTCATAPRLAKNHEVTVISNYGPTQEAELRWDGVAYSYLHDRADVRAHKLLSPLLRLRGRQYPFTSSRLYYRNYYALVAQRLQQLRPDIVHLHQFPQAASILRRGAPSAKIVLHLHAEWLNRCHPERMRRQLRDVDAIVNVSDFLLDVHNHALPEVAERSHAIYNGVDTELFHPAGTGDAASRPPRILFVGRISPEKGLHYLLEAFTAVKERCPEAQLRILGPPWMADYDVIAGLVTGDLRADLGRFYNTTLSQRVLSKAQRFAPSSLRISPDRSYLPYLRRQIPPGMKSSVEFANAVSHIELPDQYRQADIVVQPSVYETFGMPLVEAMSTGVPAIGSDVGGIPEVLNGGQAGLLAPPGDVKALATALEQLISDPERRRALGAAGRARAEAVYSWDRVTDALERVYAGALARGPI